MEAMSPVTYHPSRSTSAVFSGRPRQPQHYVGPTHEQEPRPPRSDRNPRVWIHNPHGDAGEGMSDPSAFGADLTELRSTKVACVHADNWRTFRSAVAFQGTDTKLILECESHAFRQLLCADKDILQATEILWLATPHVGLQKSWRREQESDAVVADQLANCGEIERAGMINDAHAPSTAGKTECHREAKKEWKKGSTPSRRSWRLSMKVWLICSTFETML